MVHNPIVDLILPIVIEIHNARFSTRKFFATRLHSLGTHWVEVAASTIIVYDHCTSIHSCTTRSLLTGKQLWLLMMRYSVFMHKDWKLNTDDSFQIELVWVNKPCHVATGVATDHSTQKAPWTMGKILFFLVCAHLIRRCLITETLPTQNRYYPLCTVVFVSPFSRVWFLSNAVLLPDSTNTVSPARYYHSYHILTLCSSLHKSFNRRCTESPLVPINLVLTYHYSCKFWEFTLTLTELRFCF
jgi:hypothetical protein